MVFTKAQANTQKPKELALIYQRQNSGHLNYWTMQFYYF
jgi:hypothetical protein